MFLAFGENEIEGVIEKFSDFVVPFQDYLKRSEDGLDLIFAL